MEVSPELSVIVIAYEMARELPRTLRTLSVDYQSGLNASQYEVLVIDNGSNQPVTSGDCAFNTSNFRFLQHPGGEVSPVAAIHAGMDQARGTLVGVLIDGARMASPGLLAAALAASRTKRNPVIGTLAFHLGEDVQMRSVLQGYDQDAEDRLLDSINWKATGYQLFDISVFAGSSVGGWFRSPSETNALFMRRTFWDELGGYDRRFTSPGGGLANLDIWKRAQSHPGAEVIMLLGEATFHQVHGGVATNSAPGKNRELFHGEYQAIRGEPFQPASPAAMTFFGSLSRHCYPSLRKSVARLNT